VAGVDVVAHPSEAKGMMGVVSQSNTLDRSLNVWENLSPRSVRRDRHQRPRLVSAMTWALLPASRARRALQRLVVGAQHSLVRATILGVSEPPSRTVGHRVPQLTVCQSTTANGCGAPRPEQHVVRR
jgi:hypothetical protein